MLPLCADQEIVCFHTAHWAAASSPENTCMGKRCRRALGWILCPACSRFTCMRLAIGFWRGCGRRPRHWVPRRPLGACLGDRTSGITSTLIGARSVEHVEQALLRRRWVCLRSCVRTERVVGSYPISIEFAPVAAFFGFSISCGANVPFHQSEGARSAPAGEGCLWRGASSCTAGTIISANRQLLNETSTQAQVLCRRH